MIFGCAKQSWRVGDRAMITPFEEALTRWRGGRGCSCLLCGHGIPWGYFIAFCHRQPCFLPHVDVQINRQ